MSDPKRTSGRRAAELVQDGMTLGLGTGSTVFFTLERLAERIRDEGLSIRGVPTSRDTETKAGAFGIPLVGLAEVETLDLCIDGADEIDGDFAMIKGGGGALLREKVVATLSQRVVIVVGRNKVVERLGTTFRLPVEVVPFALPVIERQLRSLGGQPEQRRGPGAGDYVTDNGNAILDVRFPDGIEDARDLELRLARLPGVVESGLFIDLAQTALVGEEDGRCTVLEK